MTTFNHKKLKKYIEEYKDFLIYLKDDFFQEAYLDFNQSYDKECGINPEIYFDLYLQNQINKELCFQAKQGNIDLEIMLIEKYMPVLEFIIRKMRNTKNIKNDIDIEAIIMYSVETYDGSKLFSLYMLDVLKKCDFGYKSFDEEKPKGFKELVEEYIAANEIDSLEIYYLDEFFKKLNIYENIKDEDLKRYAFLKYGYYNNINFSNYDIMNILNIDLDTALLMNKKCLILLKQYLGERLDLVINFLFKQSQKTKQIYITKNNS